MLLTLPFMDPPAKGDSRKAEWQEKVPLGGGVVFQVHEFPHNEPLPGRSREEVLSHRMRSLAGPHSVLQFLVSC